MENALSTIVGEDVEGHGKWEGTLAAPNGSLFGISAYAGQVVKFNPIDNSMTRIRPDFGDGFKWYIGAMGDSGVIY